MMHREERYQVIRGMVRLRGRWTPMDEKLKQDRLYRQKLAEGWVRYQGEWVTIEEKLRRIQPAEAVGEAKQKKVIKHNDKRVFNIHHHHDNRHYTTHLHEHRHLHAGTEALNASAEDGQLDNNSPRELAPEKGVNRLPDGRSRKRLPDDGTQKKLPGGGTQKKLPGVGTQKRLPGKPEKPAT